MTKFDIKIDVPKNRCITVLSGFIQEDEAKQIVDKYIAELSKLKPGFDVIADISGAKPATAKAAEEIRRIQTYFVEHGVNRVIRITGDAVLTQMQLDRVAKEVGFAANTATSVEEAARILDGK